MRRTRSPLTKALWQLHEDSMVANAGDAADLGAAASVLTILDDMLLRVHEAKAASNRAPWLRAYLVEQLCDIEKIMGQPASAESDPPGQEALSLWERQQDECQ